MMRIEFHCAECGFGIDAELHKDSPQINKLLDVHYKKFGHTKYTIKIVKGKERGIVPW